MYIRSCVWWRHQMETFSAWLVLCAGNSPVPGEYSAQRPVTRSFDAFFDLRLNKRLSKQSWGWWFETQSHSLWRHSNVSFISSGYREWNMRHIPKHTNIQSTVSEDYIIDIQLTTCKVLSHTVRDNDSQSRLFSNWQTVYGSWLQKSPLSINWWFIEFGTYFALHIHVKKQTN